MSIPNWYGLLLLALAAWRTWWFIGRDTIIERPRDWLTAKSEYLETLLDCPYCAGFWISLLWWGAFQLWEHGTLVAAAAVAITALIPIIERVSSDPST